MRMEESSWQSYSRTKEIFTVKLDVQYIVNSDGQKEKVLLPIDQFEELMECVQDVLDKEEIERLRDQPRRSWNEIKADVH